MLSEVDFLFTTTSPQKIQLFLEQNPNIDISKLRDEKRNTVLHQAAFQNNLPVIKLYIDYVRKFVEKQYFRGSNAYKKPVKHFVQQLANEGNSEGFTCMHYASYKGNVEMIKYLESLGANVLLLTNLGLNCLHLAAQGDQITSALYFYDKFDINSYDNKKGTALHWAAYVGSQDVTEFLLAQEEIQLDNFDAEDQTPLHIAVLYGNTSIVKKLLMKGADRSLPNGKGEKAIDIARSNEFQRITAFLNNKYSIIDRLKFYFNVRVKYEPQQRSYQRSFWFIFLLVFAVVSTHLFILPNFEYFYLYIGLGLNCLLLLVYFSLLIQPSIDQPMSYKQLIPHIPICPECKIPKLARMHHCNICKRCIKQYDHHCPWINGCVGKHNIRAFPVFLLLLIVSFFQLGFLCVVGIFDIQNFVVGFRYTEENNQKLLQTVYKIMFGIVLIVIAIFIIPICYLFHVQIFNLLYGKTTFQRFGGKKLKSKMIDDSPLPSTNENSLDHRLLNYEQQKQDSCSFGNCRMMCCTNEEKASPIQN